MPDYPVRELVADLTRAESPEEFNQGTRRALDFVEGLNEQIISDGAKRLACRAGCSLCCSLRVTAMAHEIFVIVEYLATHFSPDEMAGLVQRLAAHAEKVLPLTPEEHATRNTPCPMLREGCCSIYPARPHVCRRHHSLDLAACEYIYQNPGDLDFPAPHDPELFTALTEAMDYSIEVYRQLGFDSTVYELGTALAEALEDPECWERWRAGEQTFLKASRAETAEEEEAE